MTIIGSARTWLVDTNGQVAKRVVIAATDTVELTCDFSQYIVGDSIVTLSSATDISGAALPTTALDVSEDKQEVMFTVSAADLADAANYMIRCIATLASGDIVSADCPLMTKPGTTP